MKKFYCKECGLPFYTEDIGQIFCKSCEEKGAHDPNQKIYSDVRYALKEGVTYGQYKGGKRRH